MEPLWSRPVCLAVMSLTLVAPVAMSQPQAPLIPQLQPGPLSHVLFELADKAQVSIAFDAGLVDGLETPGTDRPVSLEEALALLLADTGLSYLITAAGNVAIIRPDAIPGEDTASDGHSPVDPVRVSRRDLVDPPYILERVTVPGYRQRLVDAQELSRVRAGLTDVILADAIGKLPDRNIAEALDHLPGVYRISDQDEGRYVSIRGVEQALNTVTLNGVAIAASDTDGRSGRAAPLDVMSTASLARVEIHKVFSPDLDANAIGGIIAIHTPSAFDFEDSFASLTAELGWSDFGSGRQQASLLGMFSRRFGPADTFGVYASAEYWSREYLSHLYENNRVTAIGVDEVSLLPVSIRLGSAAGRREYKSFTTSLDWRPDAYVSYWARLLVSEYVDDEVRPEISVKLDGALTSLTGGGFRWQGLKLDNETRTERQERPVHQLVMGARRRLARDWSIEVQLNRTLAREVNPYVNYYESVGTSETRADFLVSDEGFARPRTQADLVSINSLLAAQNNSVDRLRRVSSNVEESVWSADARISYQGHLGAMGLRADAGARSLSRRKFVDDREDRYDFVGQATLNDAQLGASFAGLGASQDYQLVPGLNLSVPNPSGFERLFFTRPDLFVFDVEGSRRNTVEDEYVIYETIRAGFLDTRLQISPQLEVSGGVRIEHTTVNASASLFVRSAAPGASSPAAATEGGLQRGDILPVSGSNDDLRVSPALLAKWEIYDQWLARASVTSTFARPDFIDMAPISVLDVEISDHSAPGASRLTGFVKTGNPGLKPVTSLNWDASLHRSFSGQSGWVSLAVFNKSLDGIVDTVEQRVSETEFAGISFDQLYVAMPENLADGYVRGVEFSLRRDFINAPAPLDRFGILANVSFSDSRVNLPSRGSDASALLNQSDQLAAVQLYYEHEGFDARIGLNHQGEALLDRGRVSSDDVVRDTQVRLSAQASFDVGNAFEMTAMATNLTNEPDRVRWRSDTRLLAENPGYETYGRGFRIALTRRW